MADDERHDTDEKDSSLELPTLRSAFRRRRNPRPEPDPDVQDTSILPVAMTEEPAEEPTEEPVEEPTEGPRRRRERSPIRLHLPGPLVALLTGAVVGLALVGLTSASLHLCSSMRGAPSCGKPGLLLLLAIAVAVILLGSLLLRVAHVDTHGSTSFLGVGLLVVLILLVLLPVLEDWWMVIAVPVLAMITFFAAWWLTTTYVEPGTPPTDRSYGSRGRSSPRP
ncbi:hypothetical protein [Nocardioides sp.]|jgi:hypothetical protein|uniref:hypothetical protein n=1 Tax=Nocardioides sp. TaxID=35761 RepID=UPI002F40742E